MKALLRRFGSLLRGRFPLQRPAEHDDNIRAGIYPESSFGLTTPFSSFLGR